MKYFIAIGHNPTTTVGIETTQKNIEAFIAGLIMENNSFVVLYDHRNVPHAFNKGAIVACGPATEEETKSKEA